MEFQGHLVRNLLRILTPEEIDDLTMSSSGMRKVSLDEVLQSDLEGKNYEEVIRDLQEDERIRMEEKQNTDGKAKVLPLSSESKENEDELKVKFNTGERVKNLLKSYEEIFKELDNKVLGLKRFPKRSRASNKKQSSVLILEEKAKLKKSYTKIKSKEILQLYLDESKVHVKKNLEEDDFSFSTDEGLLVNKKCA